MKLLTPVFTRKERKFGFKGRRKTPPVIPYSKYLHRSIGDWKYSITGKRRTYIRWDSGLTRFELILLKRRIRGRWFPNTKSHLRGHIIWKNVKL